ncbi:MAG: hypothetical protein NTW06_00925 [Candidatus Falkowbacteria bacterium]|nr:hypothetical protein [Candidatus Falkowbacteria bacterium]
MADYDIDNPKIIQGLTNELNFVIDTDDSNKAEDYYIYLDKILARPEIKNKLNSDLLAFSFDTYDLWRKLRIYLSANNSLAERDKIKENIRKILNESQSQPTQNKIKIQEIEELPTIANWLKDYRSQFGEEGFLDNIKFVQYLTNSINIKNLSEKEKGRITAIFNFYRRLKLSSLTNDGLEEDITIVKPDGEMGNLKEGKFEKIGQEVIDLSEMVGEVIKKRDYIMVSKKSINSQINNLLSLRSQYPIDSIEYKAIEEEIEKEESGSRNKE